MGSELIESYDKVSICYNHVDYYETKITIKLKILCKILIFKYIFLLKL